MVKFQKGNIPFSKGKHLSEKHRENISKALKGHTGYGKGTKGLIKHTKSAFKKGHVPWSKGKHHTKETKNKMSETKRKMLREGIVKMPSFKGNNHSLESRKKMSIAVNKAYEEGRLHREHSEEQIKAIIKGLIKRPTSLEKNMMKIINKYNLPYKYVGDGSFLIGYKNPDFINTNGEKIAVEVYYEYFKIRDHGSCNEYEKQRAEHFKKFGWSCLFFRSVGTYINEQEVLNKLSG